MPACPALGHGEEIKLLGVVEAAFDFDPVITCILPLADERARLAEADGLALGARLDLGDQPFLPMQTLQLPDAQPEQQRKGGKHQGREPDQAFRPHRGSLIWR